VPTPFFLFASPQSSADTAYAKLGIVALFRCLILAVSLTLWSGCSLQPLQRQSIGDLGHFEYRESEPRAAGVVVGVPHAIAEPAAVEYATYFSAKSGAGMVTAYGFGAKRVPVTRPLVSSVPASAGSQDRGVLGSIYPEFKSLLRKLANGRFRFYVGVRVAHDNLDLDRIEIATTGLTHEQLKALADSFALIRNRVIKDGDAPVVDLALDPLDEISWRVSGIKHHGVLMLAERGFNLRLPAMLAAEPVKRVYMRILSEWVLQSLEMIRNNPDRLPETQITVLDFGKIEAIPGKENTGIVVGAPHGTFDVYTAGIVRSICSRTRLAGVIATGFTPTESGDGKRINVNRPTERHVTLSEREFETKRARKTYEQFRSSVLGAALGHLDLYIDVHQNGGTRIEVATVGLSSENARSIKKAFRALRDQALAGQPDIAVVDMAIEPLDELEVGAWATKTNGILSLANRSLHFELPAEVLASSRQRRVYTLIIGELIGKIADDLTRRH
jgi:hypothetical protein